MNKPCYWYTEGGDSKKGFPIYPEAYGPRCAYLKTFFKIMSDRSIKPDCPNCKHRKESE